MAKSRLYVLLTLWHDTAASEVCQKLNERDEVTSAEQITGPYDVMVVLDGEDFQKMGKFVVDVIRKLPQVRETLTSVVLPQIDN